MKVFICFKILVILFTLDQIKSQRRITNGRPVPGNPKRYMAYLLKAPSSPKNYDAWLCGGAIVNPLFIVTSAACVDDIEFMYAIAGYDKYVPANKIEEDQCTRATKKKIVFTCVPKMYELDPEKVEKWSNVDIAAVRVESPFNFELTSPAAFCSWVPDQIEISFEAKHQAPDTDSMVLGWGHSEIWRKPQDLTDYNQPTLQYSPTLILDKKICQVSYQSVADLLPTIERYMICTMGEGNIDANGRIIQKTPADLDGCSKDDLNLNPNNPKNCSTRIKSLDWSGMKLGNFNYYGFKRRKYSDFNKSELIFTRRNGICQNDHGGPLVTWVGGREVLIGVASVFLVNAKDRKCVGPYLHTSTQCNGAFLSCVLRMFDENKNSTERKNNTRRYETPEMVQDRLNREDMDNRYRFMVLMNSRLCDLPAEERGFDMIQRRISWMHHPDGPAQNEIADELIERPQIPMNSFHSL